jgi:hypothetical protein
MMEVNGVRDYEYGCCYFCRASDAENSAPRPGWVDGHTADCPWPAMVAEATLPPDVEVP